MEVVKSFTEQMQERINASNTEQQVVIEPIVQPVVEPVIPPVAQEAVQPVVEPVIPAAEPPKQEEIAKDLLSVLKNPEIIQEDPLEKQYKEKFYAEHKDLIELGQVAKADKFMADYLKYKNDPDFDPRKLLIVNTTDYSGLDPLQLYLKDLQNKGVVLTPEEELREIEGFNAKYADMLPGAQKALKQELLDKMPKPQDPMKNWSEFVAEKEKQDKQYTENLQANAADLSNFGAKLVGIKFEGVEISQTDVRNVLSEIFNDWEAGYFTPNAKKVLEDRLIANVIRTNWDNIKENLKKTHEAEFIAKRSNAQPNNTPRNIPAGGISEEDQDKIHKLRVQFGANPGLFQQKLKEQGLPLVN